MVKTLTKKDTVKKLSDSGFHAKLESGVVVIEIASEAERLRAKKAIKDIGYDASWGTRGIITNDDSRG